MKKFEIKVVSRAVLTVADMWPDGDAPNNPTKKHVLNLIAKWDSGSGEIISEWNLPCVITVRELP